MLAGLAHLPAAPLGDGALRIRQHVDKEPVMKKQSSPISHVASRRSVNLPNSIEEFLRRQSVAPQEKLHCPECGSVMRNMETSFTSFETEKAWNLTLPVCLECDPKSRRSTVP